MVRLENIWVVSCCGLKKDSVVAIVMTTAYLGQSGLTIAFKSFVQLICAYG